jgi:hypothetical protein
VDERERACDEHVLAQGHLPMAYAEGILKVCEHYFAPGLASVAGISGANLSRRVEAIMRNRLIQRLSAARKLLLGLAGMATIALPLALGAFASAQAGDQALSSPKDEPALSPDALPNAAILAKELTADVIEVTRLKPANQVMTAAGNTPAGDSTDSSVQFAGQFSGMSVDDRHLLIGVSNSIYGFIDHVFLYTAATTGSAQMSVRDVPARIDYQPGIGLRLAAPGVKNAVPGYAMFFSTGGGVSKAFPDGSSTEAKDMGASAGLTHYEMHPPLSTSEFWALHKIEACGTAKSSCIQVAGRILPFPGE